MTQLSPDITAVQSSAASGIRALQDAERRSTIMANSIRAGKYAYDAMPSADCCRHEMIEKALHTFLNTVDAEAGIIDRAWLSGRIAELVCDGETHEPVNDRVIDYIRAQARRAGEG